MLQNRHFIRHPPAIEAGPGNEREHTSWQCCWKKHKNSPSDWLVVVEDPMAFLATAVVLWLHSSCNNPMAAPKVPTTVWLMQHPSLPHPGQTMARSEQTRGTEVYAHHPFPKDAVYPEAWKQSQLQKYKSHWATHTFLSINPASRAGPARAGNPAMQSHWRDLGKTGPFPPLLTTPPLCPRLVPFPCTVNRLLL